MKKKLIIRKAIITLLICAIFPPSVMLLSGLLDGADMFYAGVFAYMYFLFFSLPLIAISAIIFIYTITVKLINKSKKDSPPNA
jgi:hypothetical protein